MKRVIAIVGPTAVGKTKISIELAKRLNAEIISGDSVAVYKSLMLVVLSQQQKKCKVLSII